MAPVRCRPGLRGVAATGGPGATSSGFRSTASFLLWLMLLLAVPGCGTAQRASGPTTNSPTAGETSPPAGGQGSATKSPSAGQESTSKGVDADLSSVDEEMGALDRDLSGADDSLRQTEEADPSQ